MLYKYVGVLVINYFSVWRAERRFVQRVRQKINQDLTKVVPAKHMFTLFFSRKHRRERTRYWGDESPEGFFFFSSLASRSVCAVTFCIKVLAFGKRSTVLVLSFGNSLSSPRVKCQPSWLLRWKPGHVRPHWRYQGSFIVVLQHRRAQWNVKAATATSHMNVSLVVTESTSRSLKKKKKAFQSL